MQVAYTRELVKKARRAPGRFQRTFATPIGTANVFSGLLLEQVPGLASARVFIESVVFAPTNLSRVLGDHGVEVASLQEATITAADPSEARSVLAAAFSDWVDFYFEPQPRSFLIYADHDEYTTVFTNQKGLLSRMSRTLREAGVHEIAGFLRAL